MTLTELRRVLGELGLQPRKALGQNFLIDANILRIIVAQARVRDDETVLEVGPGLGVLTEELLLRARRVVAIEKDARLGGYLRRRFPDLELIEGDAVEILGRRGRRPCQRPAGGRDELPLAPPWKVVANLPYSVATAVLEQLVEGEPKPWVMVVTLQREVAQRLAARPRQKDYGALTLFTQLYYHVTIAHVISARCFHPAPHIASAVTVLERRDPRIKIEPGAPFRELVRQGFSQRRKMLRNLLADFGAVEPALADLGLAATVRAEELSLEQWIALANTLGRG